MGMEWSGQERNGKAFMTEQSITSVYPIDTEQIKKGDVLPPDLLTQIVKLDATDRKYQWKILKLKDFIAKAMANRGAPATLVIRGYSIVVLTDAESGPYNARMARLGARRIRRSRARHAVVNLENLTPDQRKEWDRDQAKLAMQVSALNAKKIPEPTPHKRIT